MTDWPSAPSLAYKHTRSHKHTLNMHHHHPSQEEQAVMFQKVIGNRKEFWRSIWPNLGVCFFFYFVTGVKLGWLSLAINQSAGEENCLFLLADMMTSWFGCCSWYWEQRWWHRCCPAPFNLQLKHHHTHICGHERVHTDTDTHTLKQCNIICHSDKKKRHI